MEERRGEKKEKNESTCQGNLFTQSLERIWKYYFLKHWTKHVGKAFFFYGVEYKEVSSGGLAGVRVTSFLRNTTLATLAPPTCLQTARARSVWLCPASVLSVTWDGDDVCADLIGALVMSFFLRKGRPGAAGANSKRKVTDQLNLRILELPSEHRLSLFVTTRRMPQLEAPAGRPRREVANQRSSGGRRRTTRRFPPTTATSTRTWGRRTTGIETAMMLDMAVERWQRRRRRRGQGWPGHIWRR